MSADIVVLVFVLYLASQETYTFNVKYAVCDSVIYTKLLELWGKKQHLISIFNTLYIEIFMCISCSKSRDRPFYVEEKNLLISTVLSYFSDNMPNSQVSQKLQKKGYTRREEGRDKSKVRDYTKKTNIMVNKR